MGIGRQRAWGLLVDWTESESLRRHARAVEVVMRAAAEKYGGEGANLEQWGVAGVLHDADYERWPAEHPKRISSWLRERQEDALAQAVDAHAAHTGVAAETAMDKGLLACDELTGFVMACCLVRPDGIGSLTPKSVRKKLKDKAFAAKVDRSEIYRSVELLEVDLSAHIQFVIDALRPHADELGLGGRG